MSFFPTREIALQIGPLAIHWYGLMYLIAFLIIWWALPKLMKLRDLYLNKEQIGSLLTYGILGTLIGGRMGYVLFYAPVYFGEHPLEILMIWHGGMSFHGGLIGVIVALILFCRKHHVAIWKLADVLVVPVALGLACGRIGNFINQELYGTVTSLPWGIQIDNVFGLRHPTQIYAALKDIIIAILCFIALKKTVRVGIPSGIFLISYGILRFFIEYVRVETASGWNIGFLYLTRGQLLTIPVFLFGVVLLWKMSKRK